MSWAAGVAKKCKLHDEYSCDSWERSLFVIFGMLMIVFVAREVVYVRGRGACVTSG